MVATIKVLTGTARGVASYFSLLEGDSASSYYSTEHTGVWHGSGASVLGLSGFVTRIDFMNVLAGRSPLGVPLVSRRTRPKPKNQRKQVPEELNRGSRPNPTGGRRKTAKPAKSKPEPVIGIDIPMSASKSVSLLHAIGPLWVRRAIEQAMQTAATKAMDNLESFVPLARRTKGGKQSIGAKLVISTFMHTLNRDDEPHLHVHCVIANTCLGEDGKWTAVNSRLIHHWTPALGRIFRCHLARELKKSLGVELVRPIKDGVVQSWFEVKGVSRKVIENFSSRRQAIVDSLSPSQMKDASKRQDAAIKTRREKTKDPDLSELRKQWQSEGKRFGLDETKVEALCWQEPKQKPIPDFARVFSESVRELGRKKAHFHEADVVSAVCEAYQHLSVDPVELIRKVRMEIANSPEAVVLKSRLGDTRLTSRENWALEKKLLADTKSLQETPGVLVKDKLVAKTLQRHRHLDEEQKEAVEHLLTSKGSIRVLSGVAGAGKSTALDAVRDAFERAGHRVFGSAIAGKAACELSENAGIESRTVASYLHHLERGTGGKLADRAKHDARMLIRALQGKKTWRREGVTIPRNSVLIIDEAGMLDTKTLSRLLHHCKERGATVILTGDTTQLPPILAGGPMDHIAEQTGEAKLTANRRQQDPDDRKAVANLRKGSIEEALKDYANRDRLRISANDFAAKRELTQSWVDGGGHRKPTDHLILTQTRAEARDINRLCQQERLKRGRAIPGLSIKHGDYRFHIGDRVAFHQPMRKYGIENGHAATVIGVDPITRKITVRLDNEPSSQQKKLGIGRVAKIPLLGLDRDAVGLGYASTTHRAQGITCENSYILLTGSMISQQFTYTQLTRAREKTQIFVDRATAGEDLESLIKAVSRSSAKDLAHDQIEKPHKGEKMKESQSARISQELRIDGGAS